MELLANQAVIAEIGKQGLWAILYVSLFLYTLKEARRQQDEAAERENRLREEYHELRNESRERENKLTSFITDISRQFERLATGVERLTMDVDEIKDELKLRKQNKEKGGDE